MNLNPFSAIFDRPSGKSYRIEWIAPSDVTNMDVERSLKSRGIKVYNRRAYTKDGLKHGSVLVSTGQRKWAEEILFVALRLTSARPLLPEVQRRVDAGVPRYTPKAWSQREARSGTLQEGITRLLDFSFGNSQSLFGAPKKGRR